MGYWKNHPEAWPVATITIGGVKYTKDQAIAILKTPPDGDATYILAHQLIAAKLNILQGADGSVLGTTIANADQWLFDHKLGSDPQGPDRKQGIAFASTLDKYNEGKIGPGHCEEEPNPKADSCGYPYPSTNPLTNTVFNENEVLRAFELTATSLKAWYNDERALVLGVGSVIVKTSGGTTTTNYQVSPLLSVPDSVYTPVTGTNALSGDQAGTDVSGRPMWPALFITDITSDPTSTAGDWQWGGTAINPDAVFGTWKGAVRTVDNTKNPNVISVTPDGDPAKNNWDLDGGDPAPGGLVNEGYGAEVRWDTTKLGLIAGHTYRLQFMVHDGDQNKVGGDSGEGCVTLVWPPANPTPTPTKTPMPARTPTVTPTPKKKTPTPTRTPIVTPIPGGGGEKCWQCTTYPQVEAFTEWNYNPNGTITIHTTLSKNFVDNTYGVNAIGWPKGHTFGNLTGSDELQLALYDAKGVKRMEFKIDYLSATSSVPSGYGSLGVSGGDGRMILGNASDVVEAVTSLDVNFNALGYVLTQNSPKTDSIYTANAANPDWIYDVWYEVTVKPGPFAAGFGEPRITGIHASPSKVGDHDCPVVEVPCPPTKPKDTVVVTPCEKLQVELGNETVSPEEYVTISACVPPVTTQRADVYLLVRTPWGDIYSVRHGRAVLKGIFPYARGYSNPNHWSGVLYINRVFKEAIEGDYTVALILMPTGAELRLKDALAFDLKVVTIVR